MPEGNPLVAQAQSQTTGVTGIGIAESAVDLANGVKDGSWVEAGLGAVGVGLEALSLITDPIGTLIQYGVSWLLEHVQPLKDCLDWLAGNPPVIQSFSDTWANVAKEVNGVAGDLANEAKNGTSGWTGPGGDAYRAEVADQTSTLAGAASLCDGISTGVMVMGQVVAAVRETVRDLIGTLVGKLISWALEEACSLGFATPLVAVQATTAITSTIEKVTTLIRKLIKTIANVGPKVRKIVEKLSEIIEKLSKLAKKLGKGAEHTSPSSAARKADDVHAPKADTTPAGAHTPDGGGPDTAGGASAGSTSTSSASDAGGSRPADPQGTDTPVALRKCENDPIDVATGEMVLAQTDVELPGVLPLVLRRVHVSSFRAGRSFGRTWASTVDQRLEFDDHGVVFVAEDGLILVYPFPPADGAVLPEVGPRWPLSRVGDDFVIEQRAERRRLHFPDGPGDLCWLATISDDNGNRIDLDRDGAGVPLAVRHSGGYHVEVVSRGGRIAEYRLLDGDQALTLLSFAYGPAGSLESVVNSSTLPLRFAYDLAGRITRWTDRNGHWYSYEYDRFGRCVANLGADGFLNGVFDYDTVGRQTRFTDALGHTTTYRLDEAHNVIAETDPLGHTSTYEWDGYRRLLSRTDPLGRTTRYTYDAEGNPLDITRPDGTKVLAEYGVHGLPVSVVQADGHVWRQEYDTRGNLVAETDPSGARVSYGYDDGGGLRSITDAAGRSVLTTTNAAGMVIATTDADGATTRYRRDAFGRLVELNDPQGARTEFTWTVEGRLRRRTFPDGGIERRAYDGEGNLVEHVDTAGQMTRFEYTGFDLPAVRVDPDGARLQFGYSGDLRLTSVTNQLGESWRYEYDAAGRLTRETDFAGRVQSYRHDAAGQLAERVNGVGQSTKFVRNAVGRVIERWVGDELTTFVHDAVGNVRYVRGRDVEVSYERDPLGRVLAETCNGRTVRSAFDVLGRRTHRLTPSNAESVWEYDAQDQPVLLRTAGRTVRFSYDSAGREIERSTGAAVLAQTWDPNNRLRSQTLTARHAVDETAPNLVQHRAYHYRQDGNLGAVDDLATGDRTFELDRMGRVTGVQAANWSEQYTYDPAGNLTQGGRQPTVFDGVERPHNVNDVRYSHDAQGRVLRRQKKRLSRKPDTWHYTWDGDDRLVGVVTPDGGRWSYFYDPFGRRTEKRRFGADGLTVVERVLFTWDGFVLAEQTTFVSGEGPRCTVWNWERDRYSPVTQTERAPARDRPQEWVDEQFYSIVTDLVGAPAELVDEEGALAWQARTTLWGAALEALGAGRAYCPLRFPGQYHDPESALNYNFARHYDPETGQYTSADPLGLAPGPNPRRYVANPLAELDPFGLAPDCERALQAARERADLEQNRPGANKKTRPTSAAGLVVDGHNQPFTGASAKGADPVKHHKDVQEALDRVPPEQRTAGNQHGRCGEPAALTEALNANVDPRGGTMSAVNVRSAGNEVHGTIKEPCSSCRHLLDQFNITAVT
ncbi:DUF6531 domain-containing protein [Amycolatopsis sp. H20-H5]|uniref:DUF6531 domain-containing protein n=1 Tax=Amycolatopsis sp. H20-H5 TaxID=3046309 RepID=UPI002DB96DCE|nr:DUF6531 domain-containing protein [Amycolatopsis sp. H20-H5]MEC3977796.1 DUF6531 domain-containing protein [Amycolatopsis sp. H20-H5]